MKIPYFCEKNKNKINGITPWFIGFYFLLVFLPWYQKPAFIGTILNSSTFASIFYRIFLFALLLLMTIFVYFANRPKLAKNMLICFIVCAFYILVVLLLGQNSFHFEGTSAIGEKVVADVNVGLYEYLKTGGGYVYALFFNYSLLFILPSAFKSKKGIFIVCLLYILVGYITVIYSLATEFENYVSRFTGVIRAYRVVVSSLFSSKNTWGKVLFGSFIGSLSLAWLSTKKTFIVLFHASAFIFVVFTYASACDTALIAEVLTLVVYLVLLLMKGLKEGRTWCFVLLTLVSVFSIIAGFGFSVEAFRTKLPFSIVYSKLSSMTFDSIFTRIEIWLSFFSMLSGYRIIFGYGLIGKYVRLFYDSGRETTLFLHNSLLTYYCEGGIFLGFFSVVIFSYGVYRIRQIKKKNELMYIVLLSIAIGLFSYSTTEVASVVLNSGADVSFWAFVFLLIPSAINTWPNEQRNNEKIEFSRDRTEAIKWSNFEI